VKELKISRLAFVRVAPNNSVPITTLFRGDCERLVHQVLAVYFTLKLVFGLFGLSGISREFVELGITL
jgi:hypothetical protein